MLLFLLAGCGSRVIHEGEVSYIIYRIGTNPVLAQTEALFGFAINEKETPETGISLPSWSYNYGEIKYCGHNPYVIIYQDYIFISFPGTNTPDKTIPREGLIELAWAKTAKPPN